VAAGLEESFETGAVGETRIDDRFQGKLRNVAAKGLVVNAIFMIAMNGLGLVKGLGVAAFLSPRDYGLWGLLAVAFTTLFKLIQVGVDDKYIQQDSEDQELAFQEAFTMQCLLCGAFVLVILIAMPLFALGYGDWRILLPGYTLALVIPSNALQVPTWVFYRKMDFVAQRRLQVYDPVVGLVVTIGLAAAGAGYWSMVLGVVAGGWTAAFVAVRASPYPLRWRFRRDTLREYVGFSGPLFTSAVLVIILAQVPVFVGKHTIGLIGVGAMGLASNLSQYSERVDAIISNTLYPAVCAVKDRAPVLLETFTKSNRLAMLWATPLGAGLALFAPDFVHHVLGDRWRIAIYPLQAFGVAAAINQIGFNWTAYYRARGETKPIAINAGVMCAGVLCIAIPLLVTHGVDGYSTGMAIALVLLTLSRIRYLAKLFPLRTVLGNSVRGMLPTVPAIGAVLGIRAAMWGGPRTTGDALIEIAAFCLVVGATTVWSERTLLKEFRGYLTGRGFGIRSALGSGQSA
jgi:O-antigen/teichoic acid export membrane protein